MKWRHLIHSAYRQAQQLLIDYKPKLVQVAEYLIEHEAISGEALNRLFNDEPPGIEPEPARPLPAPSPYAPPAPPVTQGDPLPNPAPSFGSTATADPTPGVPPAAD